MLNPRDTLVSAAPNLLQLVARPAPVHPMKPDPDPHGSVLLADDHGLVRHGLQLLMAEVLPRLEDLALFLPMLAVMGTGQALTCFIVGYHFISTHARVFDCCANICRFADFMDI